MRRPAAVSLMQDVVGHFGIADFARAYIAENGCQWGVRAQAAVSTPPRYHL